MLRACIQATLSSSPWGTLLGERLSWLWCVSRAVSSVSVLPHSVAPEQVTNAPDRETAQSPSRKEEVLKSVFTIRSAWGTRKPCKLGSVCPGWGGGMEKQQQRAASRAQYLSAGTGQTLQPPGEFASFFFFLNLHWKM